MPSWDDRTPGSPGDEQTALPNDEATGPVPEAIPVATPLAPEFELLDVPLAAPVAIPVPEGDPVGDDSQIPMASPVGPAQDSDALPPQPCAVCGTLRVGVSLYCADCGWMFPASSAPQPAAQIASEGSNRLANRYELVERTSQRSQLARWHGFDHGDGAPVPVIIVEGEPISRTDSPKDERPNEARLLDQPAQSDDQDRSATDLDGARFQGLSCAWPSIGWELRLIEEACHPALPRVLDQVAVNGRWYLVLESPQGTSLWDAWEDPKFTAGERYEWLAQVAEMLHALHKAGAIIEGLRPELLTITPNGQVKLNDLGDLLPLPLPANPPIQATPYTAPELIFDSAHADCRCDHYGFGAMLYALHLGRELTEMDFERQGVPKPFVMRFPDAHPGLARIIMKTFVRETASRFPTEEAAKNDPSGFVELARTLRSVGQSEMHGRLDVAAWTNTGLIRTNNEDAFALIHSVGSRQDDLGERLLAILADGMGGYEAGEVASAMAIEHLRQLLLREPMFAGLTGDAAVRSKDLDVNVCQNLLAQALRDTNKHVFTASRTPGVGKRGMGCTAEVVYVDGRHLIVGHVGDSRVYHYSRGHLTQVTRDQTLVNRLVELGHLTPEEAADHPRKNELQQAIGGQPVVDPLTYSTTLTPGDWVVVCSDGLTNHVDQELLTELIQRADSAEMCARRLVNLANLQGGSDNTTVIAIRIT